MTNNSQKTIPYRLSPAELENLRLLRKRMNPTGSTSQAEEQGKSSEEIAAGNSRSHQNQYNPTHKGNRP
jgi:hypothetical protein